MHSPAWAIREPGGPLVRSEVTLPELRDGDVEIAVSHCGVCHSDLHLVDDAWGITRYPLVPGHEVVGTVSAVGAAVTGLQVGDRVGVGWQCESCGDCGPCDDGRDHLCGRAVRTCVDRSGGFARAIRVDASWAHRLPDALDSASAAPLLCAGATVYAPLVRYGAGPGRRVAVVGLGGLGHLAVRFAAAMGAEVGVLSTTPGKADEARELGAGRFLALDEQVLKAERGRWDLVLVAAHADLPWRRMVGLLAPGGALVLLGAAKLPVELPASLLVTGERTVAGSLVASRAVTRDMLEFAAAHHVEALVETVPFEDAPEAFERLCAGAVRYRLVLVHA